MYDTPPADETFWPSAAAHMASIISKIPCDPELFIQLAIKHCLPAFVTPFLPPGECEAVRCARSVDGVLYGEPVIERRSFDVLLMPSQLQQHVFGGGAVYATEVVPGYQDPLHTDWVLVKRFRESEVRVDHVNVAFNYGRWMGQSSDMWLDKPVPIHRDAIVMFPRYTIDEVASILRSMRPLASITAVQSGNGETAYEAHSTDVLAPSPEVGGKVARGITKHQVIEIFQPMVKINLEKALGNGKGLYGPNGARVQKGSMGSNQRHVGLWNPIILAIAFYEREGVPASKLKHAFRTHDCLDEWRDEFFETCEQVL